MCDPAGVANTGWICARSARGDSPDDAIRCAREPGRRGDGNLFFPKSIKGGVRGVDFRRNGVLPRVALQRISCNTRLLTAAPQRVHSYRHGGRQLAYGSQERRGASAGRGPRAGSGRRPALPLRRGVGHRAGVRHRGRASPSPPFHLSLRRCASSLAPQAAAPAALTPLPAGRCGTLTYGAPWRAAPELTLLARRCSS